MVFQVSLYSDGVEFGQAQLVEIKLALKYNY